MAVPSSAAVMAAVIIVVFGLFYYYFSVVMEIPVWVVAAVAATLAVAANTTLRFLFLKGVLHICSTPFCPITEPLFL